MKYVIYDFNEIIRQISGDAKGLILVNKTAATNSVVFINEDLYLAYNVASAAMIVGGYVMSYKSAKTIPQQLTQEGKTPAIGKMKDLNTDGNVLDGELKIADYLPDKGNPKANWKQNSGILRSVMNENVPIKDVSPFPMENAGFLGAETNLLKSRGWIYIDGYWYPPSN